MSREVEERGKGRVQGKGEGRKGEEGKGRATVYKMCKTQSTGFVAMRPVISQLSKPFNSVLYTYMTTTQVIHAQIS